MASLFPGRSVELRVPLRVGPDSYGRYLWSGDATSRVGSFEITLSVEADGDQIIYSGKLASASKITVSGDLTVKIAQSGSVGEVQWREFVCVQSNEGLIYHQAFPFYSPGGFQRSGFLFDDGDMHCVVDLSNLYCDDCDPPVECAWNEMWTDMLFPDMHLVTTHGDEISCHRVVLCCASTVFKAMLTGSFKEASHAEITIHHATGSDIRAFLEFVYTRELPGDLDQGALGRILRIADMYDIADLTGICACRLVAQADKSNVIEAVSALIPYYQSDGNLAKWFTFLLNLLQGETELLVPLLFAVTQTTAPSNDLQESTSATMMTQPTEYSSHGRHETLEAATVDAEQIAHPLLNPDYHENVEIKVRHFPIPPRGLILQSFVPEASSSKIFGQLQISVLCFSSRTRDFSDILRKSELAQEMLSRNVEVEPSWANGATVFVEILCPEMLKPVMQLDSLRPWHVIVRTEHEGDLIKSINLVWDNSCRGRRPRVCQNYSQRLTLEYEVKSSCPAPEVLADKAVPCEDSFMLSESDPLRVRIDAAGTVHDHTPSSLIPRSRVTAPP